MPDRLPSWRVAGALALAAAAAVLPLLALDHGQRLLASPFGSAQLLLFQLACAVPLALALPRASWPGPAAALLALALAACWLLGSSSPESWFSVIPPPLLRSVLALGLLVPAGRLAPLRPSVSPLGLTLLAGLCILPPAAFAGSISDRLAAETLEALERQRTTLALEHCRQLQALGSGKILNGRPVTQLTLLLAREQRALESFLKQADPAPEVPGWDLRRASYLARLERHSEADEILRPLAANSLEALLLLGAVRQAAGRYQASSQAYEQARIRAVKGPPSASLQTAHRRASEGIVHNAMKQERWDQAEQACRQALRDLPTEQGRFLYRLALIQEARGQTVLAAQTLAAAAPRLPPPQQAEAVAHLRRLHQESPSCLLSDSGLFRMIVPKNPYPLQSNTPRSP